MDHLQHLARKTCLYPDPIQTIARGTKLYTIENLRKIGNSITLTDYPQVVLIPNPSKRAYLDNKDLVIKRSFSDTNKHVWLKADKGANKEGLATMQQVMEETSKAYDHEDLREWGVVPKWFGQPYILQLEKKGELRCFFIGGVLTYMMSTAPIPHGLNITEVREITPLSHLS